jgi:GT2 family glycosyltransferase
LQPESVDAASGSSAFYRRSALERVGLLPGDFGSYFEDVDLSLRLRRAGYIVRFAPTSIVWHTGSASHRPTDRRLMEQQSRNEELLFWRNLPVRGQLSALARHAAVLGGKALRRASRGELVPFLRGRLRAVGRIIRGTTT